MKLFVIVLVTLAHWTIATEVDECPDMAIEDIRERASLNPCKRPPCKLKKGTSPKVELKFKTTEPVTEIINHVTANVFGVPLPFIGVDGTSVCNKIYDAENPDQKAPCPLKANTEYIYKDSFRVENFYPSVSVRIHWSLSSNKKDLICFEVPARIL